MGKMTPIVFRSRVVKLESRERVASGRILDRNKSATADNVELRTEQLGWFLALEGSYEAVYVGKEKPEGLEIGDVIKITMEKEDGPSNR